MTAITRKVAVVTGAGSGIGQALAVGLAKREARVAISDVDATGLDTTVEKVKALGADVHAQVLDVVDRDAMAEYATAISEHYGIVHQIYNNAGVAGGAKVLDADYSAYERVLGINLWGVIHGTKEFLPHLIASGDGHVVNISSLNGIMGQAALSGYCASKFGVRGFTESLRAEMLSAGLPVKVTVVHPGGVKTNIANAALGQAQAAGIATPEHAERTRRYNEKLLTMPPERAAKTILDGVQAGKGRIIVGNDARVMDLLVRAVPGLYPRLMVALERRLG
jgi:NAD(P)-dependent dehydrogenase (short-subunit alcohol dehydrogenase family)